MNLHDLIVGAVSAVAGAITAVAALIRYFKRSPK